MPTEVALSSTREVVSMNSKLTALSVTIVCIAGAVGCATAPPAAPSKAAVAQAATSAAPAPAAPAAKYSTSSTPIGELLDNPKTRAVLEQNLPGLVSSPQIGMARGMTLKGIQQYATDTITDDVLAKVDAGFAALSR